MHKLEAVAIDVTNSVFDNEIKDILYVVKDFDSAEEAFIFCLMAHSFSVRIRQEGYKHDLEEMFKWENLFRPEQRDKLKREMQRVIEDWQGGQE